MILNCIHSLQTLLVRNFCTPTNLNNIQILADSLGLSLNEARCFTEKHKTIRSRHSELLLESITCCKKLGYSNDDILHNPMLLSFSAPDLHQHHLYLEEAGFHEVSARILSKCRTWIRRTIRELKKVDAIKYEVNVAENFIKYINPAPEKWCLDNLTDSCYLKDVHREILKQYLRWKLHMTDDEILKLFRIHYSIRNKSFRVIQENIEIAESLNFDRDRLLKCGYLLCNYPEYPKTVLRDFPNLAGADMKQSMRHFPKMVMVSPKNYIKIYGTLKEYDISDESIRKKMGIFQLSPETVRLRLEEIKTHPDLHFLFKHPRVLSLIQHHKKAKSRLSFLQELQLKCANIVIAGEDSTFDNFIKSGEDVNLPYDLIILLKQLFHVDEQTIRKKMKIHPFMCYVPFKEMEQTFDFLLTKNFKRSHILRVMHVILYPKKKVESALQEVTKSKSMKSSLLTPVQKLNLIIYVLEKEHHFTGNGIWRTPPESPENEKILE